MARKHTTLVMPIIREEAGESFDDSDFTREPTPAPEPSEKNPNEDLLLFVQLDKLYYQAFERVSGELILSVPNNLPPCELVLFSAGKEYLKVYEDSSSTAYKDSKKIIYKLESTISRWEEGLMEGQYIFPFTFKLPEYVPSTFHFQGDDTNGAYIVANIKYKIKGTLKTEKEEIFTTHK
jgi:hypothetical protein